MPKVVEITPWSPPRPPPAIHPPVPPRRRRLYSTRDAAASCPPPPAPPPPLADAQTPQPESRPADLRTRARIQADALAANLPGLEVGDITPLKDVHHTPFRREWQMLDGHDLMSLFPPRPPHPLDRCDDIFRKQMHHFLSEPDPSALLNFRRRRNSVPTPKDAAAAALRGQDSPQDPQPQRTASHSPAADMKPVPPIQRAASDPARRVPSTGRRKSPNADRTSPAQQPAEAAAPEQTYIPRKRAPKKTCGREECTLPYCRSVHHRRKLGQIQQSASPPVPGEVHWQIDLTDEH